MMQAISYLDESGDLGWKFHQPYRQGGSSRYLSLAAIILPFDKKHLPKRFITDLYKDLELCNNIMKIVIVLAFKSCNRKWGLKNYFFQSDSERLEKGLSYKFIIYLQAWQ